MIFSIALATGLGGCTMGRGDLEQWVTAEKAKKGALEPLPVVKTFETFEYRDQDLRGIPFSSPARRAAPGGRILDRLGPQPDQNRVRELLESFPSTVSPWWGRSVWDPRRKVWSRTPTVSSTACT